MNPVDPQQAVKVRMWESLRGDARHEDAAIEGKLSILERVALSETPDEASQARFQSLCSELEEEIRKMQATVLSMMDTAKSMPPGSESSSMSKHSQRFEEIVNEKQIILKRLAADFQKRKERAQLLGKVKHDIQSYQESEELRNLSSENESLRYTQRRLNDILAQADLSREKLRTQRQNFTNIADKALTIAEKVPFINGLLKKIDAKRRRDVLILAIVIAVLMFLVVLFW